MPKAVLTIDDSMSIRETVKLALSAVGYRVMSADNGASGLKACRENQFDLIIVDLNMPVMDGITFIGEARKLPSYRFVPILMLTTESRDDKKLLGKKAGATGWIVKPFDPARFLAVVQKVCPR